MCMIVACNAHDEECKALRKFHSFRGITDPFRAITNCRDMVSFQMLFRQDL